MKKFLLLLLMLSANALMAISQSIAMNRATALEILQLTGTPAPAQIAQAYRKAVLANHPDRKPDCQKAAASEKMQEITSARDYLIQSAPRTDRPRTLEEMTREMLNNGLHVEEKDGYGCTLLMFAININSPELVELLLNRRADVNAQSTYTKFTPLMVAAYWGNSRIVNILLAHRADVTITDFKGRTALSFALEQSKKQSAHYGESIKLLKAAYKKGIKDCTYEPRSFLSKIQSSL